MKLSAQTVDNIVKIVGQLGENLSSSLAEYILRNAKAKKQIAENKENKENAQQIQNVENVENVENRDTVYN